MLKFAYIIYVIEKHQLIFNSYIVFFIARKCLSKKLIQIILLLLQIKLNSIYFFFSIYILYKYIFEMNAQRKRIQYSIQSK